MERRKVRLGANKTHLKVRLCSVQHTEVALLPEQGVCRHSAA